MSSLDFSGHASRRLPEDLERSHEREAANPVLLQLAAIEPFGQGERLRAWSSI